MKKRLLSILTALALCLTLLPATAGAVEAGPDWTYDPGTQTLTSGNDAVTLNDVTTDVNNNLTIVKASLDRNFSGALDLSGTISDTDTGGTTNYTITSIGESAFSGCTSLTSISLPKSVTSIGDHAFLGCTSLTEITVAEGNPTYCTKNGILFDKNMTQLIQYPAGKPITQYTVPDGVTSIGDYAFSHCSSLTDITLLGNVTSIGKYAFQYCSSLTSVDLSLCTSLTSIGYTAFYYCTPLTDITLPESLTSIGESAFSGCTSLTSISLPKNLTSIGQSAFSDCTALKSISLPESLNSIGQSAFYYCTALTSISLPKNLTSIEKSAFSYCTALTSMDLSPCTNLTSIEPFAFSYCTALTSVTLPASVKTIGGNAFGGCTRLPEFTVAEENPTYCTVDGVLFNNDGSQLIQYPAGKPITQYTVPNGVTDIGDYAFSKCTALTSITLPESVTSIRESAFTYCTSLTSITLPESVTSIGQFAFSYCTALTSITLPERLNSIEKSAFSNCSSLTSISLPGSVTSIGQSAFSGCTSLTSISLPKSVTSIGVAAFFDCTALTSISLLSETPPTLGENALGGCGSLSQILVPPESMEAYKAAQNWNGYTDKILPRHDGSLRLTFSDSNPTMTAGSVPPTITVTLTNDSAVKLEGPTVTAVSASVSGVNSADLEAGANTTFTLTPNANLTAGTYPVTVRVTGRNLPEPVTASCTLTVDAPYVPSEDSSDPSYSVSLPGKVTGGTVTANKYYAASGETFRFTVTPDAGYELASLAVTDSAGKELKLTNEGGGEYSFEMPAGHVSFDVTFRPVRTALPFADVDEGYWAHDEIAWAYENGYMSGTSATAFTPGGTVSRQQVWMILARIAGENPADMAAAKAWAVESGISDGTSPGAPVTRQQLAALLYRYAVQSGYDVSVGEDTNILSYTDFADLSEYAIPAMQWACGAGILNGTGDGSTLSPQGSATRAQLAVMLYRWLA